MPKQKTHSGAKKKFKVTGTGKLHRRSQMSGKLGHNSPKRKRQCSRTCRSISTNEKTVSTNVGAARNRCLASSVPSAPARSGARSSGSEGLLGPQEVELQVREEQVERSLVYAYIDRKTPQARVPPALDHAHQRRCAHQRALVQPVHRGPQGGGHQARPQGARGSRGRAIRRSSARSPSRRSRRSLARNTPGRQARDLRSAGGASATAARRSTQRSAAGSPGDRRVASIAPDLALGHAAAPARRAALPGARGASAWDDVDARPSSAQPKLARASSAASSRCRRTRCGGRGGSCPRSYGGGRTAARSRRARPASAGLLHTGDR